MSNDSSPKRPALLHWAVLLLAAGAVGGGAGYLGSRAGAPDQPAAPPVAPQTDFARAAPTAQPASAGLVRSAMEPPDRPQPVAQPAPIAAQMARPDRGWVHEGTPEQSPKELVQTAKALLASNDIATQWDAFPLLDMAATDDAYDLARQLLRDDAELAPGAAQVLLGGPGLTDGEMARLEGIVADTSLPPELRAGTNALAIQALRKRPDPAGVVAYARKALAADAATVRGSAVAGIATLPSEQAVPLLIQAVGDSDPGVANGALSALKGMHQGDPQLGPDKAAWQEWWEKRQAGSPPSGAEPPAVPDDFQGPGAAPEAPPAPEPTEDQEP
jgi:hypothetical protein